MKDEDIHSWRKNGINGRITAILHLLFAKSGIGNICIWCQLLTQLAPQNNRLNLSFVKDEH